MKICLIGASGFIGQRLLEHISADPSRHVIAAMRRPHQVTVSGAGKPNVEMRRIEATDPASIIAATEEATHLVNCMMGTAEAMDALTRTLVGISGQARIQRVIHFSSTAVYGAATGRIVEDTPLPRPPDAYSQSKQHGEAVIAATPQASVKTIILRPALVGGAGSELWTLRIARLLRSRRLGDLGAAGEGLCNLVDVDDVVHACALMLNHPAGGGIYHLAMPNPPTWNAYFRDLADALGAGPIVRRSAFAMRLETDLIAPALRVLRKLAGKTPWQGAVPDPIPHGLADHFTRKVSYHSGKIERETGFEYGSYRDLIVNSAKGP